MSGTMSIDGLVSGFDTTEMIDQIMAVERRPILLIEAREARVTNQLAAFRALNTGLLAMLTSARTLARPAAFTAKTIAVSDETILTASASSGAAVGTYAITVNSLARSHQVASQGYGDIDSTTVGAGDIQIQVGDGEVVTVEIDTTNNTLSGLRDAINNADAGVSASILNDGSDALPYRLLLTADETGTENAIGVTVDLTGGTAPDFSAASIGTAVAADGNTYTGAVASGGTYTGTTNCSYLVEIVEGGPLASATYRVSEDGGTTWGSTLALAGGTIDVFDDAHGSDLGVDATFTDATFAAGDQFIVDAFVPTVQEAADAQIAVGSGAGQITIASASNSVTDVLPGMTLDLVKADADETVVITVEPDTATIQDNVQTFVEYYNSAISFIRQQTSYNAETEQAGILLGNTSVMRIQQELQRTVLGVVPGLQGDYDGLYSLGITVGATGTLTLDSSALTDALDEDLDAVARVFQASGESTHAKVEFVGSNVDTEANVAGYTVSVTQAAARGALTGAAVADPAIGGVTIDSTNDKLALVINGVSTNVLSLSHTTYHSGAELANEIAAKIEDADVSVAPVEVVFVDEGATGYFEIHTEGYGSGYSVALGDAPANNAATLLGLVGGTATEGSDVGGTIDGFEATGTGQLLKATDTNSPAEGLQLLVTLTDAEVGEDGVGAIVSVVKGAAKQAADLLDYLTDPVDGYVKSKEDRFTSQAESYRAQIERREEILERRRARLVARFVRLEQALGSLNSQSSYLSGQLSNLSTMMQGI